MSEAIFSIHHVGVKSEPAFREWRNQLARRIRSSDEMTRDVQMLRRAPDLSWLLGPERDKSPAERNPSTGPSRRELRAAMDSFMQLSIAPYWQQILTHLTVQREARMKAQTDGGEYLLNFLHPGIRISGRILELPAAEDADIELEGKGLLLAPSLFLGARPGALLRNVKGTDGRPVLVFSAQPDAETSRALWSPQAKDGEALDALMGRTRAQLLRLAMTGGTTSELAQQVGTSAASVSQHTSVLRKSGLIRSERHRNTMNHRITALGQAVLNGRSQPAAVDAAGGLPEAAAETRIRAQPTRPLSGARREFGSSRRGISNADGASGSLGRGSKIVA
ncbi:winged helix-turn-helix domain-containing protein [Streptomyces sp. NPDC005406]|uniref:ArsR/SmtB family transcription factor n=1 Tax=Streptomyces sp. NPDC005406 TaxID=3155339 RepID=UPI0034529FF7